MKEKKDKSNIIVYIYNKNHLDIKMISILENPVIIECSGDIEKDKYAVSSAIKHNQAEFFWLFGSPNFDILGNIREEEFYDNLSVTEFVD